jgi:hypothetical protein
MKSGYPGGRAQMRIGCALAAAVLGMHVTRAVTCPTLGSGDKVVQGGTKVCWDPDERECVKTVHRVWPNEALPGELAQVLPRVG